jgi:hypothetical protein
VQLPDLPQFTILGTRLVDGGWVLDGEFSQLETVREGRSWLYVSRQDSLIGDLEALDPASRKARFNTMDPAAPPGWIHGATLPWLDGCWQAYHVTLVLDEAHSWERVKFVARDALQGRMPGWRVLREATDAVPEPGEILIPGAWDHEHCMLCEEHIDPGHTAYTDRENNWLCARCYVAYAEPHDLSFVRRDV